MIDSLFDLPPAPKKGQKTGTETKNEPVVVKPIQPTIPPKENPVKKTPTIPSPPLPPVVEEPPRQATGRSGFNRPSYIRKLKKIA